MTSIRSQLEGKVRGKEGSSSLGGAEYYKVLVLRFIDITTSELMRGMRPGLSEIDMQKSEITADVDAVIGR